MSLTGRRESSDAYACRNGERVALAELDEVRYTIQLQVGSFARGPS
jgi:hypothetical protein